MNYIIDIGPYHPYTGGSVALHRLAHNLCLIGEKAFLTTPYKNPEWLGDYLGNHTLHENESVMIYPEVVLGNPYGARHVVRWILNEVGVIGGDSSTWGERDLAFVYAEYFYGKERNRVHGELRAFDLKLDYWKNLNYHRNGECYIVRKGKNKTLDKHSPDSKNIDSYDNHSLLLEFNARKRFVCYDSECFLAVQAALCGCEVVVIPKEGISKDEWKSRFPYFQYGIAYGFDDLDHAKDTLHLVKPHMESLECESLQLTREFVEICENAKNSGYWS